MELLVNCNAISVTAAYTHCPWYVARPRVYHLELFNPPSPRGPAFIRVFFTMLQISPEYEDTADSGATDAACRIDVKYVFFRSFLDEATDTDSEDRAELSLSVRPWSVLTLSEKRGMQI